MLQMRKHLHQKVRCQLLLRPPSKSPLVRRNNCIRYIVQKAVLPGLPFLFGLSLFVFQQLQYIGLSPARYFDIYPIRQQ